jgi:acyl-CoA thioesterase I
MMMKFAAVMAVMLLGLASVGCEEDRQTPEAVQPPPRVERPAVRPSPFAERQAGMRIIFLGDSLTAGYGVEADEAYPALIEQQLRSDGLDVQVINMGVSGDTTAGGLNRLDWSLKQQPDLLVVGLGGNDGLRGIDLAASEQNLRAIIQRARNRDVTVLLLGMMIPPNYGEEYTGQFREMFPRLAQELGVPLVPFLLEGVGGVAHLNQPDGIHPTAEGHRLIAQHVLTQLRELVHEKTSAADQ